MSDMVLGYLICAVLLAACLAVGWLAQRLCEHEDAPLLDDDFDPRTGRMLVCERCGGTTAHQYGVSVWWASTRRDGEVTYDSSHRWCTHCRETVEAEIDDVVGERVEV